MKVFSELLNAEIELEAFEGCVTHKALKHYFLHELDKKKFAHRYDISFVAGAQWPVAKCVIDDALGNHIVCFGEASPANMQSDIDKNNPYMCASKRAFNGAVVEYLGLPGRVSESEASSSDTAPAAPEASATEHVAAPTIDQATASQMALDPEPVHIEPANVQPASASSEAPWDAVYDSGKYKGAGKTYREVAEENPDYVQWLIDKGRNREVAAIFSQYLASKVN